MSSYWNDATLDYYLNGGVKLKGNKKPAAKRKSKAPRRKSRFRCMSKKKLLASNDEQARYCVGTKKSGNRRMYSKEQVKANQMTRCVSKKKLLASKNRNDRFCRGTLKAKNRVEYTRKQVQNNEHRRKSKTALRREGAQALRDLRAKCKARRMSAQHCRRIAFVEKIGHYADKKELRDNDGKYHSRDEYVQRKGGRYRLKAQVREDQKRAAKRGMPIGMMAWRLAVNAFRTQYGEGEGVRIERGTPEYDYVRGLQADLMEGVDEIQGRDAQEKYIRQKAHLDPSFRLQRKPAARKPAARKPAAPKRKYTCEEAKAKFNNARGNKAKSSWRMKMRHACK